MKFEIKSFSTVSEIFPLRLNLIKTTRERYISGILMNCELQLVKIKAVDKFHQYGESDRRVLRFL